VKRKVGFYIEHGLEIRLFLLSGLVTEIRKSNEVCLYIKEDFSEIFKIYSKEFEIQFKILPLGKPRVSILDKFLRMYTNSKKRGTRSQIYSHFGKVSKGRFYDGLFNIWIISLLGNVFFRAVFRFRYRDKLLVNFFKNENLSDIYLVQYETPSLKKIGINSALCGINTYVFINTLKVLYIDDFVAFPVKKFYTWNSKQNEDFQRANLGINRSCFKALGSPYHTFLQTEDIIGQEKLIKKYGIDADRPVIVYSLIFEKVYKKEYLIKTELQQ
jgi:hypothetical protein